MTAESEAAIRQRYSVQPPEHRSHKGVKSTGSLLPSEKINWRQLASIVGFALIVYVLWSTIVSIGGAPKVKVEDGEIRGTVMTSRGGRRFFSYRGIPYASPPLGDLRFKDPIPPTPWSGTFEASRDGPMCQQMNLLRKNRFTVGQEDCLYLNVYVPETVQSEPNKKLDVLVWIHGGGFIGGTGGSYMYGPQYFMDKDVVLVTMNYRLGPLGFLSTGDDVIPGNFGLKDQVMALKWIQSNIEQFGGNKDSVTIFGVSAGGTSTHLLMLSPLAKGLLHRAISQSGTALAPWVVERNPIEKANKLSQMLDCPTGDSTAILECLQTRNAKDIILSLSKFPEWDIDPVVSFKVVVEHESLGNNRFLPKDPRALLEAGEYNHVPWITGFMASEGCLRTAAILPNEELLKDLSDNFDRIAPITLDYQRSPSASEVTQKVRQFYFGDTPIINSSMESITNMYSDRLFIVNGIESINMHLATSSAPVYQYLFDYRGQLSYSGVFGGKGDYGVCHGDDMLYMFRSFVLFPDLQEERDLAMVDMLVQLWTNFAMTGNPTPSPNSLVDVTWPPVTQSESSFLHINPQPRLGRDLFKERVDFWNSLPLKDV